MEDKYIIITHVLYKNNKKVSGPYFSIINGLLQNNKDVLVLEIPLVGYENPVFYGKHDAQYKLKIPKGFGKTTPVKYLTDFILIFLLLIRLLSFNKRNSVVIGIDPLSTVPAVFLRFLFNFKLIFYCVDFSENRFSNNLMQKMYEYFDKVSSVKTDQTWVVCESLAEYKGKNYKSESVYTPNSFTFNESYFETNKNSRTGNRVVWTGSILTDKQIHDIVTICAKLQMIRQELEFWFIPTNKIDLFKQEIEKNSLKNTTIYDVNGQDASSKLVSQCDLGLAIYDKDFGSTKYIEPIKIWEYMMCGLPFIISCEPSLNKEAINEGIALQLKPDNKPSDDDTLHNFISKENLIQLQSKCLQMAKKYDIKEVLKNNLFLFHSTRQQ